MNKVACPFCHCPDYDIDTEVAVEDGVEVTLAYVVCDSCGACGPVYVGYRSPSEAKEWVEYMWRDRD